MRNRGRTALLGLTAAVALAAAATPAVGTYVKCYWATVATCSVGQAASYGGVAGNGTKTASKYVDGTNGFRTFMNNLTSGTMKQMVLFKQSTSHTDNLLEREHEPVLQVVHDDSGSLLAL